MKGKLVKHALRFQLISDVHLEHYYARDLAAHGTRHPDVSVEELRKTYMGLDELQPVIASLLVPAADHLIVAGDLTDASTFMANADPPYADLLRAFFVHYAAHFTRIFYVLGNHEYYRTTIGLAATLCRYRERIRAINAEIGREAVTLLENDAATVEAGGATLRVLGATMWSAVSARGAHSMNDYAAIRETLAGGVRSIPITYRDTLALHEASRAWLHRSLNEAARDKERCLVITHHLPSFSLIDPRHANSPCNDAFASDLDDLVAHPAVAAWAFGHTHSSARQSVGQHGAMLRCNPRGYPSETGSAENASFDTSFVLQLS